MRYGTYSTFDAPIKDEDKALEWLKDEFEKIDGSVFRKMNSHDFGMYPSFEVNYPDNIDDIHCMSDDDKTDDDWKAEDEWHDKANAIEEKYSEKFMQD